MDSYILFQWANLFIETAMLTALIYFMFWGVRKMIEEDK